MMNRKSSFLEPQVDQYGSHMVMTNVTRHSKFKFINIDSKYRDNIETKYDTTTNPYKLTYPASFHIELPERVNDVKSLMVCNAEIPMSFYNISASLGNNYFKIVSDANSQNPTSYMIKIANGEYTRTTLEAAINSAIHSIAALSGTPDDISFTINTSNLSSFTVNVGVGVNYSIVFDVDAIGNPDVYNFKKKLGWLLGFRQRQYSIDFNRPLNSENIMDLNTIRYLYLALEEYTKGTQNSFLSPMKHSFLQGKTIIAKITLNKKTFSFGDILPANNFNGYLLSDRRQYSGKVDLQKLNVHLIDDNGTPVDLNGIDFSFCIEVEHE